MNFAGPILCIALGLELIVCAPRSAIAADPLPIVERNLTFTTGLQEQSFDIDLGTLPTRPRLVVTATPPRPDIHLQIEATDWTLLNGFVFNNCPASILSASGVGDATLATDLFACGSGPSWFSAPPSPTATIKVRVLSFGSSIAPADVSVTVRGETRPATGEVAQRVDPPGVLLTASLVASKDTVLYEDDPTRGNGLGEFLWVGRNYVGDFNALPLTNGWTNTSFGTSDAAATVVDGIVYLRGAVQGGTSVYITTLPPSMRPASPVDVAVDLCGAVPGLLSIEPNGALSVYSSTTFSSASCFTSLDGVSFATFATGFTPLSLSNGWENADGTNVAAASLSAGIVRLKGAIRSGTSSPFILITIATLPVEMRPATNVSLQVGLCGSKKGRLWIQPTGEVIVEAEADFSDARCSTFLDGASFAVSAAGFAPLMLANGWINAPLGTSSAAAKLMNGIVHLKGAISSGAGAVAFTLPVGMRPPANVYVPIDLCDAKKGRLFIQPDGQVFVFDQLGFADAMCFTSLDGATFAALTTSFPSFARHSLVSFDLRSEIAPTATVSSASLRFNVTDVIGSGLPYPLRIFRVAPDLGNPWAEGFGNADGTEFETTLDEFAGATWDIRNQPFGNWGIPGGDPVGAQLAISSISAPGERLLSSMALRSAVQDMVVSSDGGQDGFVLESSPQSLSSDEGIQMASRDHPDASAHPRLVVEYTSPEVYETGQTSIGTVSFIDAASNLRWIYDTDADRVFETTVGGICEVLPDPSQPNVLPYTYRFAGKPGFTGVDCCAWRVSSSTGVVGTGQALFFHNLDPATSLPPDSDGDGIRDGCDNCPLRPNGPFEGTCLGGSYSQTCQSNLECAPGVVCSLSQEFVGICQSGGFNLVCTTDDDCAAGVSCRPRESKGKPVGTACPEPGFAVGLAAGLALMAWRKPRRIASRRFGEWPQKG